MALRHPRNVGFESSIAIGASRRVKGTFKGVLQDKASRADNSALAATRLASCY